MVKFQEIEIDYKFVKTDFNQGLVKKKIMSRMISDAGNK